MLACSRSSCVFGLDEAEFDTFKGIPEAEIHPTEYVDTAHRYVVKLNPWLVMRILGEHHGHILPQQPLIAQSKVADSKILLVFTVAKKQLTE